MRDSKVRTRIAPSPTGFAHVGTAYTALFNFAYARKNAGQFILRIEDSDVKRNVPGVEETIYSGLSWLGIDWDEGPDKGGKYGPYKQSQRLNTYKEYAQKLLRKSVAYEDEGAIRFKNPGEDIEWQDLVRGRINFPGGEVGDFVILKSDGYPTYNFGVVVDDILMKISHVVRGEEHISNTPRQLALYKALKIDPPFFAHLPTLRNTERKKLSKRRDPVDLRFYQEEGYLPEALVNFLCLLGWSHPRGREIFSLQEFIDQFDLARVRKAGPIFDMTRLDWINGEYIRRVRLDDLNSKLETRNSKFKELSQDKKLVITSLVRERIKKLSEFDSLAGFFLERPKVDKKLLGVNYRKHLDSARRGLEEVGQWDNKAIDARLLEVVEKNGFKTGDFFMDLRVAITGSRVTPPINESIVILGKEETIQRLEEVRNR